MSLALRRLCDLNFNEMPFDFNENKIAQEDVVSHIKGIVLWREGGTLGRLNFFKEIY